MRKTLRGFYRPFRCPQNASLRHPCIILSTFSKNVDLLWRLSRSLPRPINLKAQRVDVRSFSVQPHFKNLTFSLPKQFHILQRTLVVKCFWCTCRSSRRRKHAEAPCHCGQRTVMEMGLLLHNHLQGLWPLPCCSTSSAADQSSGRARLYVTPPPHSLPAKCDAERARIIMPLIAPCIPFRWVQVSQQALTLWPVHLLKQHLCALFIKPSLHHFTLLVQSYIISNELSLELRMKKAGRKGFKKADTAALWHGKGLDPPTDEQHTRLKEINTYLSYLQLFVLRSHYGRCFWAVFVSLCLFFFSLTLCLSRLAKFYGYD